MEQSVMQKGRALQPGDTIGIVSPSGPVPAETLEQGIEMLRRWGYKVLVGQHVLNRWGYLAGSDQERASDLNAMFANQQVQGIICARGGYGAMRILPLLDWGVIKANPKFFCGFSDITALHAAMEKRAGLVTFHGPMAGAFGEVGFNAPLLEAALRMAEPLGEILTPAGYEPVVIQPGVAQGRLMGGNLMLVASLLGTPWEPDFAGRILVLEDVDEKPYAMDRMLTQLLLAGKLQQVAGVLFGDSPSCMYGAPDKPSLTLLEVLQDRLAPLGVPVLYGFPCGHTQYRVTLPLGVHARLDATAGKLTVLEEALR